MEGSARRGRPAQPAGRELPVRRGADHTDARRERGGLRGAEGRLRPRPAGRPDQRADRVRAALPPAGPRRAGPPRQPGLGRRRELRHRLPRAALGTAATGQRRAAVRARRPGAEPPAGPGPAAVGDVPRRGAVEAAVRGHHQDPPRDGRRHRRGGHRPGHPRHQPDAGASEVAQARRPRCRLATRARAVVGRADRRRGDRHGAPADSGGRHRARRPVGGALDRRSAARCGGRLVRCRAHGRAARAGQPAQRRDRRAAPVRVSRAPTSTTTAGSARPTAARSTTWCWPPSRAPCAPGC